MNIWIDNNNREHYDDYTDRMITDATDRILKGMLIEEIDEWNALPADDKWERIEEELHIMIREYAVEKEYYKAEAAYELRKV